MCGRVRTRGKVFQPGEALPIRYAGVELLTKWGVEMPHDHKLLFNARRETIDTTNMWKQDWNQEHKAILPVDAFYEHGVEVTNKDGGPIKLLCLYLQSQKCFVVITTNATAGIEKYHGRMPVIVYPSLENLQLREVRSY